MTDKLISRLLVANRGEIARRVMRTAASMGIHTVAVYADPDAAAPFVSEADDAEALGGRTAAETYLDVDLILAAADRTDADAVHPGYGFLSENAGFAQAVIDAGLIWVGPPPDVIAAMGDKLSAKRLMEEAGVPVLPSIEVTDRLDVIAAATEIGFPILVKASAGGGGKGMRVVDAPEDVGEAIAGARREAASAFGDDTVFLERYLTGTRHVEIQILADGHGNVVHCFERECSIQRRHQKVIEEAPSAAVGEELRARMGAAAVTAAKKIGYENAGTVEFLLAGDGSFHFLEVNTRLQVEHPVTEAVIGRDLVRDQLLVAQGAPLEFSQDDISITGCAVEARVYAEDPARDFLPATGTVLAWQPPHEPMVRVDSGVETGSEVGIEFDPMLAKVIAYAPTRVEAARKLALALERTRIQGVVTNRDFLVATLRHPEFLAGNTTTEFIESIDPARARHVAADDLRSAAIAAALTAQEWRRREASTLQSFRSGWRNSVMPDERVVFRHGDDEIAVEYRARRDGTFAVTAAGHLSSVVLHRLDDDVLDLDVDGHRLITTVHRHGTRWWVHGHGGDIALDELPRFPEPEAEVVAGGLTAPMPGQVLATECAVGDSVEEGQLLVLLEAMKMEHRIVAPFDGVVGELRVAAGDQVGTDDMLVVIDAPQAVDDESGGGA
ncbi:MAG: biotin carboxylase N-terminal domain-containing protein [Acidimicrobiia bacterium]|nr:biotin carboxylase N-terminal domain-containing protein [Acidimicrobiia bacterium]